MLPVPFAAKLGLSVETWFKVHADAVLFLIDAAILINSFAGKLWLAHVNFAAEGSPLGFRPFLEGKRFYFHIK